jgi:hypothetical protein
MAARRGRNDDGKVSKVGLAGNIPKRAKDLHEHVQNSRAGLRH